jgi:hypothetical protein
MSNATAALAVGAGACGGGPLGREALPSLRRDR